MTIKEILKGIDKTEMDERCGWWETSTGAKFGAERLEEIVAFTEKYALHERIYELRTLYEIVDGQTTKNDILERIRINKEKLND